MKLAVVLVVFLCVAVVGGAGAWYFLAQGGGEPVDKPTTADEKVNDASAKAPPVPAPPDVDMNMEEVKANKKRGVVTRSTGPEPGKDEKPYGTIDYSDDVEMSKARKRALMDIERDRARTSRFLNEHDEKTRQKANKMTAIERWLAK